MATWTPDPSFYPSPRMAMRENRAQRRFAFVSETGFRFGFLEFEELRTGASLRTARRIWRRVT